MIDIRPFDSLGHRDHGWLDTRYHFSFSDYLNRDRMGWGMLRVWNDDKIASQTGFPPHPHSDMEIITYVRTGAISHRDSMGNAGKTDAGDVQVMSAGKGVTHAEYNLESEDTTLFQIWIRPDSAGGEPSWGSQRFPQADRSGQWVVLASGDGAQGALPIRSDGKVLAAFLKAGESIAYEASPWRHLYLVSAKGAIRVNGLDAAERDGIAITDEEALRIEALEDAELVLVDTR